MFSELRELREGESEEIQGVGNSVRVEGIGKVLLICETEEGEMTEVILEEVKFAPSSSEPRCSQQVPGQGSNAAQ